MPARANTTNLCGENVAWSLSEDGALTISGTGDMFSYYDEQVPWDMSAVKKVVVESSVTRVGGCAFMGCANLTTLVLPQGVRFIGENAFDYCDIVLYSYSGSPAANLGVPFFTLDQNIFTLPANTTTIESEAFAGLGATVIVEIPEAVTTIARDAFNDRTVAFRCAADSLAAECAAEHGIPVVPD